MTAALVSLFYILIVLIGGISALALCMGLNK